MPQGHQPDRSQPSAFKSGEKPHTRRTFGDRRLGDDIAARRYRDVENFQEEDWRQHATGNFPETLRTPTESDRVRGEKPLKA